MILRIEFSVIALIGIILLIGIVKKNAIMMIDFALEAERERAASRPEEAIYQACLLRFRPIMMTTMAALLGALAAGAGHGTAPSCAGRSGITIVGGLHLQPVLTLYTTPVIYLTFDRLAPAIPARPTPSSHAIPRSAVATAGPVMNVSAPFIRRRSRPRCSPRRHRCSGCGLPFPAGAPLPQVDFPTIQVSASLPGASPETMASSVATPLERQFGRIAGVTEMTSSSSRWARPASPCSST